LQSKANRQGGGESIDRERTAEVLALLEREQRLMREGYEKMLAWDLRRELARINLGVAQYTEWYWKSDLHNIFHFLQLRLDPHAQHEIRVYGEAMAQIVRAVAPVAWEAFEDYQLQAERFSRLELEALARLVGGETGKWPSDQQVSKALPDPWRGATRGAVHLLAQALVTLEDYRPAAHGIDVEALVADFTAYLEWLKAIDRPHRLLDRLRIPRLR